MSSPIETVLQRLADHKVKPSGKSRWVACCPAHEDRTPSLVIGETPDGRVLLHCHAGCPVANVVGAMGLDFPDLFPGSTEYSKGSRRTATYKAALEVIKGEALLVTVAASNLAHGHTLTPQDLARLQLAGQRIQAAAEAAGV